MTESTKSTVDDNAQSSKKSFRGETHDERWERISLMYPIVGSHIRRIGVARVTAGGGAMYLCIPLLFVSHYTLSILLYQFMIRPLFRTPKLNWRDFIVVDRHRIEELSWFDKLNCQFCGYANGISTMMNVEIDHVNESERGIKGFKFFIFTLFAILYTPILIFFEANLQIIYNLLVSRPLGMHRVSIMQAATILEKEGYAKQYRGFTRLWLLTFKNQILRFAMCLEQIESSWCPLTHFENRKGVVYPKHHEKFFGPQQIKELREQLSTVGSTSDRKPFH